MSTTGFNLVTDPWIPVGSGLASIEETLIGAHELDGWPCSDPAFAEALIRLLVPMVYRITRMDDPSLTRGEFADRQREHLGRGRFDPSDVRAYLSQHSDRFWLANPPEGCVPFAQDPALAAVDPHPASKAVSAWASGNNPTLGPHAPCEVSPSEIAAQQLLVLRCYAAGGLHTKHPEHAGQGKFVGAPLRGTTCIHPVGQSLAATLIGHLVPLPHDTDFGQAFWENRLVSAVAPYTRRSGLLEQVAVRQDKTMLFRANAANEVTGFTLAEGRGVNRTLFCSDPYWLTDGELEPIKPRDGRAFWREAESLLGQSDDGSRLGTAVVLDWAIDPDGGGSNYHPADFAWAAVSHRGDKSKELSWSCSYAPHLLSIFPPDAAMRCKEFLSVANEVEQQMAKQLAKVWHAADLMPSKAGSKAAVYTPARSRFWRLAEADFWETARFGMSGVDRDGRLRTHALAGYDEATVRLLHDRRSHRAVVESRRWLELWNRHQDATAYERQEAP